MYRKIVLPTDGSDASRVAVELGLQLARFHGAEVLLVSVLEPLPVPPAALVGFVDGDLLTQMVAETEQHLEMLKHEAALLDLKSSTLLRRGDPATEILAVATEEHADLILMAAHQQGRIASLLLGSVSHSILRDAPCPVQVIGERVIECSPALQQSAAALRAVPTTATSNF